MKRYNVIGIDSRFDESPDGNWIEYPDHAAEIARLKALLIARDGGGHDVDCKSHYQHVSFCNCGHDEVQNYIEAAK